MNWNWITHRRTPIVAGTAAAVLAAVIGLLLDGSWRLLAFVPTVLLVATWIASERIEARKP